MVAALARLLRLRILVGLPILVGLLLPLPPHTIAGARGVAAQLVAAQVVALALLDLAFLLAAGKILLLDQSLLSCR